MANFWNRTLCGVLMYTPSIGFAARSNSTNARANIAQLVAHPFVRMTSSSLSSVPRGASMLRKQFWSQYSSGYPGSMMIHVGSKFGIQLVTTTCRPAIFQGDPRRTQLKSFSSVKVQTRKLFCNSTTESLSRAHQSWLMRLRNTCVGILVP